jgi:hypothetical protein
MRNNQRWVLCQITSELLPDKSLADGKQQAQYVSPLSQVGVMHAWTGNAVIIRIK